MGMTKEEFMKRYLRDLKKKKEDKERMIDDYIYHRGRCRRRTK